MFSKHVSTLFTSKPVYKDNTCIQYSLTRDQLLSIKWLNPPYQTDLSIEKVTQMIQSYNNHPEFGRFKNTIVFAVRMTGPKLTYLVDGQHRMDLLRQVNVHYSFTVLFYPIKTDDEMRQLFREMNYDSHKNLAYISLGTDAARIVDDLIEHYTTKPFTKTKKDTSRLYTLRVFVELISEYITDFSNITELIEDLETKQKLFIQTLDFTHSYSEECDCIEAGFIMPIKECNFIDYLKNPFVEPYYNGKGKTILKTIPLSLKKMVWDHHIGMNFGKVNCPVCKTQPIFQISFHCGHIIAKRNGGLNTVENLKPICQSCNSSMGTTNMNEFMHTINNGK